MTVSQNKKVSVIVPNYNYAKYLKKRIESILRQDYPIYELIVLDDASTDNSLEELTEIFRGYGVGLDDGDAVLSRTKKDGEVEKIKFTMIVNEKNSGKAVRQWEKGFETATGDYIWIAEADDCSSKHFLEEVMKGFDDSKVVLSYVESKIINKNGFMIAPNFRWSRDKERTGHYRTSYIKEGTREIEEIMAVRCTIPNVSSVVFKNDKKIPFKKYLEEATSFSQVGDWYFYAKVLTHGKISYNHKSLNSFRVHKGSKTADSKKDKTHYDEIVDMHKYFSDKYELAEDVVRRMINEEKRIEKRFK